MICGGEDEPLRRRGVARRADPGEERRPSRRKLAAAAAGARPDAGFAWAGAFGSTATGLPIIRRLPRRPRIHAVMGYGGNGITFSRIAAEIIATELGGGDDRDAPLFAGE